MKHGHWDNYEEYQEYEKLDEMPKRITIRKPVEKGTVKKEDEQKIRKSEQD